MHQALCCLFRFFELFEKYDGYKTGKLKLKKPEQLQVRGVPSGVTVWNMQVTQIPARGNALGEWKPSKGQQSVTQMLPFLFSTLCTLGWMTV